MRYFHYCCEHSLGGIISVGGTLQPNPAPGWQPKMAAAGLVGYAFPVVWVTDVDVRSRADAALIGLAQLGGDITGCNRVAWRFQVPNVGLAPWASWADDNADPTIRRLLEASPGADPSRWWVAARPVAGCRVDQRYRGPTWR